MKIKLEPRDKNETQGIACLPLVRNIPHPKQSDMRMVQCCVCGCDCWESDLAREAIAQGTKAMCTMCALRSMYNN